MAEDGTVSEHDAPKGVLVNGVGAGDSMVAGFLAGWQEAETSLGQGRPVGEEPAEHAFRMGLAAGSASAFSRFLASGEEVRRVYASMADI